jgi:hypothetical protein
LFHLPSDSLAHDSIARFERRLADLLDHRPPPPPPPPSNRPVSFPRNVTDVYQLDWRFADSSRNNVSLLRRPAAPAGNAYLALSNTAWNDGGWPAIDVLFGELALYSSAYVDDGFRRFALRGFYLHALGVAFLVGAADVNASLTDAYSDVNRTDDAADRAAQDFAMAAFPANGSALELLHAAARYDAFELLTLSELLLNVSLADFASQCYVKMLLRFDALPGATNEHWRYRRTPLSHSVTHAALRDRPPPFDAYDLDALRADTERDPIRRVLLLDAIDAEQRPGRTPARLALRGFVQSPVCGVELLANGTSMELGALNRRFRLAGLLELLLAAGQCWLSLQLLNSAVESPSVAGRISVLTTGTQAAMDLVLSALLLATHSFFDGAPNAWGIAACVRFLTFVGIGAVTVLQSMYARGTMSRRNMLWFVCQFYCGTTFLLFLINGLGHVPLLLVAVAQSFWLPQILTSAWEGHVECPMSTRYIVFTTLLRSFEPLYAWACPHNIWSTRPNSYVWLVEAWLLVQAGVLLLQRRYGARALTPAFMWKDRYSYYRELPPLADGATERTCTICLSAVTDDHMVTPCNHVLHRECLTRWMLQKLECPTCRAALPEP